jgi:signal transduction histidine kinase
MATRPTRRIRDDETKARNVLRRPTAGRLDLAAEQRRSSRKSDRDAARNGHSQALRTAKTFFDTPQRNSNAHVRAVARRLAGAPLVRQFLEGYPTPTVLLDARRQVVAFNAKAAAAFKNRHVRDIYGSRIGELEGCVHASDPPAGCGTSKRCAECGVARAIKTARSRRQPLIRDCRLIIGDGDRRQVLDVRAHTSRIVIDGGAFTLLAFEDMAEEKRRKTLERVFFHDVLNTANVLSGACRLLSGTTDARRVEKLRATMLRSATQLVDEIEAQRDLLLAERGDLAVLLRPTSANGILDAVVGMYRASPVARDRRIELTPLSGDVTIRSDSVHAVRCLGNLVKNALEAVASGETVTLAAEATPASVVYRVLNSGVIPTAVQERMFERAVSLKAVQGRGIGTYSVKLIAEQYLHGKVSFRSNDREGTMFLLELPRSGSDQS